MPPSTRRYAIELIVNTKIGGGGGGADGGPGGGSGSSQTPQATIGALDGMVDRISRYLLGVQGIRMAWREARAALDEYMASERRRADRQMTASEKAMDWDRALREAYRNEGGFTNPSLIPEIRKRYEDLMGYAGFTHIGEAAKFSQLWSSDVKAYTGSLKDPKAMHHLTDEQSRWMMYQVARSSQASGVSGEDASKLASAIVGSTDWYSLYKADAGKHAYAMWEKAIEGLKNSRSDLHTNIKNLVPYIFEMVKPMRDYGRITGMGEQALTEAIRTMRDIGEYKPEQAETLARNAAESARFLTRPSMVKAFKGAGLDYVGLLPNYGRIAVHYDKLKEAGKLPPGMTLEDYLRNISKTNVRGGSGISAIISSEISGLGESTQAQMDQVNARNAEALANAYTQALPSFRHDTAQARKNTSEIQRGMETYGASLILKLGSELATKMKWGYIGDPRWFWQKGNFRIPWLQGEFDEKTDSGAAALYARLAFSNALATGKITPDVRKIQSDQVWIDQYAGEFSSAREANRIEMLQRQYDIAAQRLGGDQKVEEYLKAIVELMAQQVKQNQGSVVGNNVNAGLIRN